MKTSGAVSPKEALTPLGQTLLTAVVRCRAAEEDEVCGDRRGNSGLHPGEHQPAGADQQAHVLGAARRVPAAPAAAAARGGPAGTSAGAKC